MAHPVMIRHARILCLTAATSAVLVSSIATAAPAAPTAPAAPAKPTAAAAPSPAQPAPTKAASPNARPAGAIARATGHLFREGLTAGFSAESVQKHSLKADEHGLLTKAEDGALTDQLWQGMDAGDIRQLLEKYAPDPAWPNGLSLARRILLTDAAWPSDENLQALRLEKMIDLGAVIEAAHLYNHLNVDEPGPALLKQGVRAMLMAGEPGIACLEYKANTLPPSGDDAYWNNIEMLCTALLLRDDNAPAIPQANQESPVLNAPSAPGTTTPTSPPAVPALRDLATAQAPIFYPTSINELLSVDPNIIEWLNLLPGLSLTKMTATEIPESLTPLQAARLAGQSVLPARLRLELFARSGDLRAPELPNTGTGTADPVVALLHKIPTLGPAQVNAFAHEVAALPPTTPPRLLTLFAPTLGRAEADNSFKPEEVKRIAAILLAADSNAADPWLARIRTALTDSPKHDVTATALLVLGQTRGHPAAKGKFPLSFSQLAKDKQQRTAKILKNLSELLDSPPIFIDNPRDVYEKKTGLTAQNNYVMPSQVLRRHLSDGKDKGQIGAVALTSLLIIQGQNPGTLDPDLLADMLSGMIGLGLVEEARQIATTVLLGVIKGET